MGMEKLHWMDGSNERQVARMCCVWRGSQARRSLEDGMGSGGCVGCVGEVGCRAERETSEERGERGEEGEWRR